MQGKREDGSRFGLVGVILISVVVLLFVMPWAPEFPGEDLERSWQLGLNYATANGLRFGSDVIFTFGPFSAAHTRGYFPGTFSSTQFVTALLGFVLLACKWRLRPSGRASIPHFVIWALMITIISSLYLRDALFLISPYLVLCNMLQDRRKSAGIGAVSVAGIILLAAISLVKLTFAIASISVLALSIFLPVKPLQRIVPVGLYLLGLLLFWVLSGQQLGDICAYFVGAIPIVSGYTDAMSLDGSLFPVALFIIGAIIAFLISIPDRKPLETMAMVMTLFFSFKAAYVRQDIHEVIGAGTLVLIALWYASQGQNIRSLGLVAISLMLCGYSIKVQANLGPRQMVDKWARHAVASLRGATALASDPQSFERRFHDDLNEIARQHPIPGEGSMDSYSYHQTAVIASSAIWSSRPVMQSYSAYTAGLAELNATHLSQQTRPERLVLNIEPIDGRYGPMDDGRSWPEIWSRYKLSGVSSVGLLFRAGGERQIKYTNVSPLRAHLGDEISLAERRGGLIWVRVKIRKNLVGNLLGLFFRPPQLMIDVKDVNGHWSSYRYLARVGEGGFLLSPAIIDSAGFEKVTRAIEQGESLPSSVDAFRIAQSSSSWVSAYESGFELELSTLQFGASPK